MKSKLVLMVSHELSLQVRGPLLLMELTFLLRGVGADVVWITNQKLSEPDQVIAVLKEKVSLDLSFGFWIRVHQQEGTLSECHAGS
ncbi:hypothetical protein Ahy_B10g105817 isoform D [Arachis hypogaea]|uniref:Uncharacterized protein n=1 Tax=Arachis hypogaea TaxID=3818 RepID=A0A444X991_ARAHY|nr:hypothetical protein Ahy_B10g105817 isoform D [Arachis hypogaea]